MKGFETQVIGGGAKTQPLDSLLLVGLEVRRGKAGVRKKNQVRDDKTVGTGNVTTAVSPDRHCGPGKPKGEKFWGNLWAGTVSSLPSTCVHRELSKCRVNERMSNRLEGQRALLCPVGCEGTAAGTSTETAAGAAGSCHVRGRTILPAARQTSAHYSSRFPEQVRV